MRRASHGREDVLLLTKNYQRTCSAWPHAISAYAEWFSMTTRDTITAPGRPSSISAPNRFPTVVFSEEKKARASCPASPTNWRRKKDILTSNHFNRNLNTPAPPLPNGYGSVQNAPSGARQRSRQLLSLQKIPQIEERPREWKRLLLCRIYQVGLWGLQL